MPLAAMHCIREILIKIVLVTITASGNDAAKRSKRAHVDNFNVLLNLYKMNPLKKSPVYNTFLNSILLPNKGEPALNINSKESVFDITKATLSVKQLENLINAANYSNSDIKPPDFDVDNIGSEKFTIDIQNEAVKESSDRKEDFNSIFGHLESVEDDHIPVTKMLPVNNTNSVTLVNINEAISDSPGEKYRNVNKVFNNVKANVMNAVITDSNVISTVYETRNYLPDDSVIIMRK